MGKKCKNEINIRGPAPYFKCPEDSLDHFMRHDTFFFKILFMSTLNVCLKRTPFKRPHINLIIQGLENVQEHIAKV